MNFSSILYEDANFSFWLSVDQIPSLNDNHLPESLSSTAQMDSPRQTETRLNEIPSMVGESHQSLPFANSCLYSSNYLSNVSSIGSPALRGMLAKYQMLSI